MNGHNKLEYCARLAFLFHVNSISPIRRHDKSTHETQNLANICNVNLRTIQRDLKLLEPFEKRFNELLQLYSESKKQT